MQTFPSKKDDSAAMRILPTDKDGWVSVMLLPFRVYGVIAFFISLVWDQGIRRDGGGIILWILSGYAICLAVLAILNAVLAFMRRPGEPRPTWTWTIITLVLTLWFAWRFLPELAK
jgi:hypothetical protein